jgi:thioesterase domain-containing protein
MSDSEDTSNKSSQAAEARQKLIEQLNRWRELVPPPFGVAGQGGGAAAGSGPATGSAAEEGAAAMPPPWPWPWSMPDAAAGAETPWGQFPWGAPSGPGAPWWTAFPSGVGAGVTPGGATGEGAHATSPVVRMKPSGERPPLYLVHGMLGSVFPFHKLALHLDPERPLYGLQARGLNGNEEPRTTITSMAEAYAEHILKTKSSGPIHVGGYSFGGWVAWEIARVLREANEPIGSVILLGALAPLSADAAEPFKDVRFGIQTLGDVMKLATNSWAAEFPGMMTGLPPMQRVTMANQIAAATYAPDSFEQLIDLVLTEDQRGLAQADETLGWARLTGTAEVHVETTSGSHFGLFEEPQVKELGARMEACMLRREDHG